MLQYLFALLPVAATCGWYAGRQRSKRGNSGRDILKIQRDYFKGLNYLINEQPDKAVDVFIKLLEVDSDTVETHLALGSLFRRRGEVERAIRIHQNIIARPNLAPHHRFQALSELGQDYLRAGVLDRAERLFLELIELGEKDLSSYRFLLSIYQQEKDWQNAINIAKKLLGVDKTIGEVIAQYYCELAEECLDAKQTHDALGYLKKAQGFDANCVRASLIRAAIEYQSKNYKMAIHYYQKVIDQDSAFISEVVGSLVECYRQLDAEDKMIQYFKECLALHPHISLVIAIANSLQRSQSDEVAAQFIASQIQEQPTLVGLKYLLKSYLQGKIQFSKKQAEEIYVFIERLLDKSTSFRCGHCGFASQNLFWLCPSCHKWKTFRPSQISPTILEPA